MNFLQISAREGDTSSLTWLDRQCDLTQADG